MPKATSSRCRPFVLTFLPGDADASYKPKVIPINSLPVEVESQHFKGHVCLVHDTGNEPAALKSTTAPGGERRGIELQIQGHFKHAVSQGEQTTAGIWVGGELQETLKLGWIMQNVVQLCMKYARKKTEGRLHFTLGGKTESPQLSFPIGQLFTVVATPKGEEPPKLGSPEMANFKWPGAMTINIEPDVTYTMIYKTPYMDLCSWELLKVPGVSPLPIESILGDLSTAHVMMYDVGEVGGKHADWRKGALLEWAFSRGGENDAWVEEQPEPEASGAKTPLDDNSEASEVSEAEHDDGMVAVDDQEDAGSDSSESSVDTQDEDDEEDEIMSRAESQALFEIEGWRPRMLDSADVENVGVRMPYYIEAIDRRRRRKVRIWYVFAMTNPVSEDQQDWWHAKAASELASLCRPRRRLRTFRRGPGARRYTCCAVKTLESFRNVVNQHLQSETRLRTVVMDQAAQVASQQEAQQSAETLANAVAQDEDEAEASEPSTRRSTTPGLSRPSLPSKAALSPAAMARNVAAKRRRSRGPLLPPRFFTGTGNICGLAFAHAREGRGETTREALIGSIHFEGRLCEELMRLTTDGTLRCFTPYDCERPRVKLLASDILHVQRIPGLFLGRFHLWQVQSILKVFVFCSDDEKSCEEWIDAIKSCMAGKVGDELAFVQRPTDATEALADDRAGAAVSYKPTPPPDGTPTTCHTAVTDATDSKLRSMSQVTSMMTSMARVHMKLSSIRATLREPGLDDVAAMLVDTTRARRWKTKKRMVLNDRLLITDAVSAPTPSSTQAMLEQVLTLTDRPVMSEFISFVNNTCVLKAARFANWSQVELMTFWVNLYHCLLLHGWLVLGKPNTRKENVHFHSRVSYLVGPRPFSLREVERVILRVMGGDTQGAARAQASGFARSIMGFCGLCRKRNKGAIAQGPSDKKPEQEQEDGGDTSWQKGCLPISVTLPRAPWGMDETPCLFTGEKPEPLMLPKPDLRSTLVLNRGDLGSMPTIPVFSVDNLDEEMKEVARAFVNQFVTVEERDGRLQLATLPSNCQGLRQNLGTNPNDVLHFIWQFAAPEWKQPGPNTKVKFSRPSEEPRKDVEFTRFVSATTPRAKDSGATPEQLQPATDVIKDTSDLLEKLAGPTSSPTADKGDVLLEIDGGAMLEAKAAGAALQL